MQGQLLDKLLGAVVLLRTADGAALFPAAVFREGEPADPELTGAATRAFSMQKSLVTDRGLRDGKGYGALCDISIPIRYAQRSLGSITLRVKEQNEERREWLLGQLERSAGWLARLLVVNESKELGKEPSLQGPSSLKLKAPEPWHSNVSIPYSVFP